VVLLKRLMCTRGEQYVHNMHISTVKGPHKDAQEPPGGGKRRDESPATAHAGPGSPHLAEILRHAVAEVARTGHTAPAWGRVGTLRGVHHATDEMDCNAAA